MSRITKYQSKKMTRGLLKGRPLFAYKGDKMSKRKVKRTQLQNQIQQNKNHFELRTIYPLTSNQQRTFDSYRDGQNLILHGYAGTGKSFISQSSVIYRHQNRNHLCLGRLVCRASLDYS